MPRDWNSAYEQDDTPWDKGYAAPPLKEFLLKHSISGKVLVPGCGAGHDVRLLASVDLEVTGMDIAPSAISKAGTFKPAGNEIYTQGDFLDLDQAYQQAFDWVVEHTCLCAIEPVERKAYATSVRSSLKPGGHFLGIFYKEVSNYTGDGPPHPISAEEVDALFLNDFEVLESYVPSQTYPSRPVGSEEVRWMRLRH